MKIRRLLFIAVAMGSLSACSSAPVASTKPTLPAKILFEQAKMAASTGDYDKSVNLSEQIRDYYPQSSLRREALLLQIYSHFKGANYTEADVQAGMFLKSPDCIASEPVCQEQLNYAHYMQGLSQFEYSLGFLERYLPADLDQRNIQGWENAFNSFKQVTEDSSYYPDARQHMIFISNDLALHKLNIAEFDYNHQYYVGAIRRAQEIIEDYPRTPAVMGALDILGNAYKELGMTENFEAVKKLIAKNKLKL